ncbi:MAG: hypothetical protein ACTHJT_05995 [Cytophaga sp.]|uniref:hypothetical protein n=1 Tax=Cytophaga sp. TaxID=29535 RepID=UPI003F7ED0E8
MEEVTVYLLVEGSSEPYLFREFKEERLYITSGNGIVQVVDNPTHVYFSGPSDKFIAVREPKGK